VVIPLYPQFDSFEIWCRSVLNSDTLGRHIIPQNVKFIYNNFSRILSLPGLIVGLGKAPIETWTETTPIIDWDCLTCSERI